jgi:glycosyltransferase involved in cell wall biosynthesis
MECSVTRPIASVIIPTRDRRVFVRRAIEYFERRQPFVEAELIIVDGGRRPLSDEDVRGHKCIQCSTSLNCGEQLNIGIAQAQGEVIIRQDDDDWYSPDWYDVSLRTVLESEAGMAGVTDFYAYGVLQRKAWRWYAWGQDPKASHWSGGTMSFRRAIWERNPFNDLRVGSDREFLLQAYTHNPTPRAIVPDGTLKYVMFRHGRNITGSRFRLLDDPASTYAVREILGTDMSWYDDLSDLGPSLRDTRPTKKRTAAGYLRV